MLDLLFYGQNKIEQKMSKNSFRKHLSVPGMLSVVRICFDRVSGASGQLMQV